MSNIFPIIKIYAKELTNKFSVSPVCDRSSLPFFYHMDILVITKNLHDILSVDKNIFINFAMRFKGLRSEKNFITIFIRKKKMQEKDSFIDSF